jgi:inward rectifier potassium channel
MAQERKADAGLIGGRSASVGMPTPLSDLYYTTMRMSWLAFVAGVAGVFVSINLVFGIVYAGIPGAVSGMVPGSVVDGFFFSAETLATVGYGEFAPHSSAGRAIATVEILVGLFFSATVTGLIFARFTRPREALIFSRVAVVALDEGAPALMVRVASTRAKPLADAHAQMVWSERLPLADGRLRTHFVDLPLARDHHALFSLTWTLIHRLEPGTAFEEALRGERPLTLVVTVIGLDTLLATQSIGSCSYSRQDILVEHEFLDVVSDVEGTPHVDLMRFHEVRPAPFH